MVSIYVMNLPKIPQYLVEFCCVFLKLDRFTCNKKKVMAKATMFNLSVLIRKIQNPTRKCGEKKYLRKKNIEPIFGKVNEVDEINKTLDKFLEKLMRAMKWNKLLIYLKKG